MTPKPFITHLSYSALKSFFTSPAKFYREYVMKDGFAPSITMAEGKAWHRGLEALVNKENVLEAALKCYDDQYEELKESALLNREDMKKFQDKYDKGRKVLKANLLTYPNSHEAWRNREGTEQRVAVPAPVENALPIVAVIDVFEGSNPVDYKYVSRFSGSDEGYRVQAWFCYHAAKHHTGKEPEKFIIEEFKKSANRDGSSQVKPLVIEYEKEWLDRVGKWYAQASEQIVGQKHFVPNPFQFFGGDDWVEYLNGQYDTD